MTTEPLEFEPETALESLLRSGYAHCARNTPRGLLDPFMEQHVLSVFPGEWEFTITLVPSGVRGGRSVEEWERIRKDREQKRQKAAAAKKRRQA